MPNRGVLVDQVQGCFVACIMQQEYSDFWITEISRKHILLCNQWVKTVFSLFLGAHSLEEKAEFNCSGLVFKVILVHFAPGTSEPISTLSICQKDVYCRLSLELVLLYLK